MHSNASPLAPTPPEADDLFRVSVDPLGIFAFLTTHYAERYIPRGGSKVKWITGREGSGKTHALHWIAKRGQALGFLVAEIDAGTVLMRGMAEFGQAVLSRLNKEPVFAALSRMVVASLGYDSEAIPPDQTFLSWLVDVRGRVRELGAREIREGVEQLIGPYDLEPNLKAALATVLDERLGVHRTDTQALFAWLNGESVPKRLLAPLGITQSLTRLNGRGLLQSWGLLAQKAGLPGLLITLDHMEQLVAPKAEGRPYYPRGRREEVYEMLRQWIDEGDRLKGIWLVVAARPALFDDVKKGIKTYPALDFRINNEVLSTDVNRFADCLDWDQLFASDPEALSALTRTWADFLGVDPPSSLIIPETGAVSPVRRTVEALGTIRENGRSAW